VGLLVGMWKVLTTYLQVLGTVRHIRLRALPEMSNQALAFADLSAFTSFVALDCVLPGPQEWHAFLKVFARTIALPVLLLAASAAMWTSAWLFRHAAVRLHRRFGVRVAHPRLRRLQLQAAVAPDPLRAYLNPRMLISMVVLAYSLYPLVTSGLLVMLQCDYIPGPLGGAADAAALEYARSHYQWLQARDAAIRAAAAANGTGTGSSSGAGAGSGSRGAGAGHTAGAHSGMASYYQDVLNMTDLQLCRPGQPPDGLCWVSGRFWSQDYNVPWCGLARVCACACAWACACVRARARVNFPTKLGSGRRAGQGPATPVPHFL
jgi:hypothetical protein